MYYFKKGNAALFKWRNRLGLLFIILLFIVPIVVQAVEKKKFSINREVNELIEDVEKNTSSKTYSKEIDELKNIKIDRFDPEKELSFFQQFKLGDENPELKRFFTNEKTEKKDSNSKTRERFQYHYFISFSMPKQSLSKAVEDAERVQAILTLRGMKNDSMKETMMTIKDYIGEKRVQFHIDPVLFEKFDIKMVPALVLIKSPECQACGKGEILAPPIFGDVNISYALQEMKKHSPDNVKPVIEQTIAKLESNYYENKE